MTGSESPVQPERFKIAAVQASSVFLDRDATIDKACRLIEEAAGAGATLVAFPEAFVSGYPVWVWFIPAGQTHALRTLFAALVQSAVSIPDPAVRRLAEAAGDCKVTVAIGVNERNAEASNTTLYNTLLYLGPDGTILGKRSEADSDGRRAARLGAGRGSGPRGVQPSLRSPWRAHLLGELHAAGPVPPCRRRDSESTSRPPGIAANRGSRRYATSARRAGVSCWEPARPSTRTTCPMRSTSRRPSSARSRAGSIRVSA